MLRRKSNADKILETLIENIIITLDELSDDVSPSEFTDGGKYAYLECLEIISEWSNFYKYGIGDIYKKYPID